MPTITSKELNKLGWRMRDGKPVRIVPTEARKPHEKIQGIYRSRLESDYAQYLDILKSAGEVRQYFYEAISIHYTPKNRYRFDFKVDYADGHVEVVETKGFARTVDPIKCNAAASILWPWKVVMVQRVKGEWIRREF